MNYDAPISVADFVAQLLEDQYANWSEAGATALYEHLCEMAAEHGFFEFPGHTDEVGRFHLDHVAVRCDWSEYSDIDQCLADLEIDDMFDADDSNKLNAIYADLGPDAVCPVSGGGVVVFFD